MRFCISSLRSGQVLARFWPGSGQVLQVLAPTGFDGERPSPLACKNLEKC